MNLKAQAMRESKESSHVGLPGPASKKSSSAYQPGLSGVQSTGQTANKLAVNQAANTLKPAKQFGKASSGADYDVTSPHVMGLNLFQSIGSQNNPTQHEVPYFSQRGPSSRAEARRDRELQVHTSNDPRRSDKPTVHLNLLASSGVYQKRKEETGPGQRQPSQ